LLDPDAVPDELHCRWRADNFESQALCVGVRPHDIDRSIHDAQQVEFFDVEFQLAGDDTRQIQQRFYEARLRLGVAQNRFDGMSRSRGRQTACTQEMRIPDYGSQRRAEFMREDGQELVLQATCALDIRPSRLLARQELRTLVLGLLALGDIDTHTDHSFAASLFVAEGLPVPFDPAHRTVGPNDPVLDVMIVSLLESNANRVENAIAIVRMNRASKCLERSRKTS
jgi:hypothetical protein